MCIRDRSNRIVHEDRGFSPNPNEVDVYKRQVEGHKRVSVLKYFGAISIPGVVTRLLPKPSDDPEVVAYYEFLDFYQMTGLNFVVFKRPGEYRELLQACLLYTSRCV